MVRTLSFHHDLLFRESVQQHIISIKPEPFPKEGAKIQERFFSRQLGTVRQCRFVEHEDVGAGRENSDGGVVFKNRFLQFESIDLFSQRPSKKRLMSVGPGRQ
jgi:hypothetical protein